jgi:hypothetical protein
MIVIRALDGTDLHADENAVVLVAGAGDAGTYTMVRGVDRDPLMTAEDAAALVARLPIARPLAQLTRPDSTPVWIKGSAVIALRAPLATERPSPGAANAVVILGGLLGVLHQAVREDVAAAEQVLNAHGANV